MQKTPKGLRLHIGIFGKRNVGKSSILNALTQQKTSIVSDHPGTTTDPVEKTMELLPVGPVVFIDTAGIDDIGALGEKRIQRSNQAIQRTELAILVTQSGDIDNFESSLIDQLKNANVPTIAVCNKSDIAKPTPQQIEFFKQKNIPLCTTTAIEKKGAEPLRKAIIKNAPLDIFGQSSILSDLVPPSKAAVLVVPIDKEAPKGRLILPQVQAIRELLDADSIAIVTKERELTRTLNMLNEKPALVVTDSQAFLKVAADTPDDILMTSFSILFARFKGDLYELTKGTLQIENLKPGDKILIAEACTHHPITDDIGTVKIPRWLKQYIGGDIQIDHYRGHDFPENISQYKLIIHCAACIWNPREMLYRIEMAKKASIPITNYGLTIAYTLGIFDRALKPFPEVYDFYCQLKNSS